MSELTNQMYEFALDPRTWNYWGHREGGKEVLMGLYSILTNDPAYVDQVLSLYASRAKTLADLAIQSRIMFD